MARIACLGAALQDICLIDRDDFVDADIAGNSIFSQLVIGTKVDIDRVSYGVGGEESIPLLALHATVTKLSYLVVLPGIVLVRRL